jgi:PAC2 family
MAEPVTFTERPELDAPVLIVALDGWIDAGGSGALAANAVRKATGGRTIATFDTDTFIDYRARRPVLQLREGVNTGLQWPSIELATGSTGDRIDVLLLTGAEPDAAWRLFVDTVATAAERFGVRMMVSLGAYPFAAPHTRPARLSVTCSSAELADTLPYLRSSLDVPAGAAAALQDRLAALGVPGAGLWAQVPHYASAMPYPSAAAALLDGLGLAAGVRVDPSELLRNGLEHAKRLDELVAGSDEHVAMLRQLETAWDADATSGAGPRLREGLGPLPSGDELAAELERFLRDQGNG